MRAKYLADGWLLCPVQHHSKRGKKTVLLKLIPDKELLAERL